MSKKILILALSLLLVGGYAYGFVNYGTDNAVIIGHGGAVGTTPPTEIIKVRYGYQLNPTKADRTESCLLVSGTVVVWDINSADGYTISLHSYPVNVLDSKAISFAGVMVSSVQSASTSLVRGYGNNVGYMAIRGYCLASIDDAVIVNGAPISVGGGEETGSFGVTVDNWAEVSQELGIVLDTGATATTAGLKAIWLK